MGAQLSVAVQKPFGPQANVALYNSDVKLVSRDKLLTRLLAGGDFERGDWSRTFTTTIVIIMIVILRV